MKILLRRLVLAVLALAAALAAGTFLPRPLWPNAEDGAPATRRILVLTNPIHTDIAIPIDDGVRGRFAFLGQTNLPIGNPEARWLLVGWGSRAFYTETPTWADLKPGPLLKGLTLDRSVMHVDVWGAIGEPHPAVTGYDIGAAGFDRLIDAVAASFEQSEGKALPIDGAGYGDSDMFFEARGRFTAVLGCNTWTARMLREAGLTTGWWNPLPATLGVSLDLYN